MHTIIHHNINIKIYIKKAFQTIVLTKTHTHTTHNMHARTHPHTHTHTHTRTQSQNNAYTKAYSAQETAAKWQVRGLGIIQSKLGVEESF